MGTWWPGVTGEAAHPAVTSWVSGKLGKQMPTVHVSHSGRKSIYMGLQVPIPSPARHGTTFYRLLVL